MIIGILFAGSILMSGCQKQIEGWGGFYYPSGYAEDGYEVEKFASEEECKAWGQEKMSATTNEDKGYMCGYNCSYSTKGGFGCSTEGPKN